MAHHYRIATIVLTLAVAVAVPAATATAQQPSQPNSLAGGSPCSEVCSGGGYGLGNSNTSRPTSSLPSDHGPCSEVCSGGGYGSVIQPSHNTASIPSTSARVLTPTGGFDWADAGIGASGMLALTVIGLGGALTLARRRTHRIHGQDAS
jgi:hypothetical protein